MDNMFCQILKNMYRFIYILIIPAILITTWAVFLNGCATTVEKQSGFMQKMEITDMSSYELDGRLNEFAIRFAGVVEEAADNIIEQSDDPLIRENALIWKINALPTSQKALFLGDPLAALIDISVFCLQMRLYFEQGEGRTLFGSWQHLAVDASKRLEADVREIWHRALPREELSKTEENIMYNWAKNHPIESQTFLRVSISDTLYNLFEGKGLGLQETVGSIAVSIFEIKERLTLYTDLLPKQARWQAEYVLNKAMERNEITQARNDLSSMGHSLDNISGFIDNAPDLVTQIEAVVYRHLKAERQVIFKILKDERIAVFAEIDRQRIETMHEIEKISGQTLKNTEEKLIIIADHIFWRILQLCLILGTLSIIAYVVLRKVLR
jgi:hypothetical protein